MNFCFLFIRILLHVYEKDLPTSVFISMFDLTKTEIFAVSCHCEGCTLVNSKENLTSQKFEEQKQRSNRHAPTLPQTQCRRVASGMWWCLSELTSNVPQTMPRNDEQRCTQIKTLDDSFICKIKTNAFVVSPGFFGISVNTPE
jgi:hypothetical protein